VNLRDVYEVSPSKKRVHYSRLMRKLNGFDFQHLFYFASLFLNLFSKNSDYITAGLKLFLIIISALNAEYFFLH